MPLRKYQADAVASVLNYFKGGSSGHPLVVLPTGAGKTHVLGGLCKEIHRRWPHAEVIILSHVQEILKQDYDSLLGYLPPDKVGLYSAGLKSKQVRQFTVAGIQSVYKRPEMFRGHRLVIVDEAHLIPPSGEGRYRTFLEGMEDPKVVGLTATPFRLGLGYLTEGDIFDSIVYEKDVVELIKEGYLSPLTTKATEQQMSTRGVAKVGGDFNVAKLSNKLDKQNITQNIVNEMCLHRDTRKSWLVFAIDIEHAEHVTAQLNARAIVSACIHSKMDTDRGELIELFKAGVFQCLVSVETLTTGFDAPNVDMVALLRPTTSPVLHIQMIGRGLRIAEGKKDCLVLDFAGNTARLGPINKVTVPRPGVRTGEGKAPIRTCPECSEIMHTSIYTCPSCGYQFPKTNGLMSRSGGEAVIAEDNFFKVKHKVDSVEYQKYVKASGGVPTLRVTYLCGLRAFSQWIPFEHPGRGRHRAKHWWNYRNGGPPPKTVEEAVERSNELRKPSSVIVDESGQYMVIKECIFGE